MQFPPPRSQHLHPGRALDAVVPADREHYAAYLAEVQTIRPWGPIPRMEAVLHGLIGHGNGHLGRASYARTLIGLEGLPY